MAHLTRNTFIKVASIFSKLTVEDGDIEPAMDYLHRRVIPEFIKMFEDSNDLFDKKRFLKAIGKADILK